MSKKRRQFTETFKAKVALEALKGVHSIAELASKYQVHPNRVSAWKKQLLEGAADCFKPKASRPSQQAEVLIESLYEEIGRLKMDLRWYEKKL